MTIARASLPRERRPFGDWAMLRRMLVDGKRPERKADGSRYRRRADAPPAGGTEAA